MPAFPFGQAPTIADYLAWAESMQCSVQTGFAVAHKGSMKVKIRIVGSGGRFATIIGKEQAERLLPSEVGRLDRRLGLDSPFSKIASI